MIYFKHQSNMRHDLKIRRVIQRYGLEGYGLYNLIVESITESLTNDSPLPDLQENCEDIADLYNGNTSRINEIMNYMINQGLFELDELTGSVLCGKVYKFLDTSQTRSESLRQMIKSYKEHVKLLTASSCVDNRPLSQTVSDGHGQIMTNMKETDIETEEDIRIRRKEKKQEKKENPVFSEPVPSAPASFEPYIPQEKNYSVIWENSRKHWNKKSNLPEYKRALGNESDMKALLNFIAPYEQDEITAAIDNYSELLDSIECKYGTFKGFMRSGVDQFHDGANPHERYKGGKQATSEEIEEAQRLAEEIFG